MLQATPQDKSAIVQRLHNTPILESQSMASVIEPASITPSTSISVALIFTPIASQADELPTQSGEAPYIGDLLVMPQKKMGQLEEKVGGILTIRLSQLGGEVRCGDVGEEL
jgi:hypothetical protein